MQTRSIPSVTLYIRITDEKGNRRYERVNRRKPQLSGGTYCLHFYTPDGKRKWTTVGTDINAALKAKMEKESELLTRPVEVKPSGLHHLHSELALPAPFPLPLAQVEQTIL